MVLSNGSGVQEFIEERERERRKRQQRKNERLDGQSVQLTCLAIGD